MPKNLEVSLAIHTNREIAHHQNERKKLRQVLIGA
jgi:hypothetical protein